MTYGAIRPTTTQRDALVGTRGVHGGNRRGGPEFVPDLAAIADWNARQEAAKDAYADARCRADCPLPHFGRNWCTCRARRKS